MNNIANADTDRIQMFETIDVRPVDDLFFDLPPTIINPQRTKISIAPGFHPEYAVTNARS